MDGVIIKPHFREVLFCIDLNLIPSVALCFTNVHRQSVNLHY